MAHLAPSVEAFKTIFVRSKAGGEFPSDMTLNQYIRTVAELRGTKYMCREAGCGACLVSVVKKPGDSPVTINSCLAPVFACKDWEITTIEKLGNKKDGYHALQTTLADTNGTQCGHCTPGFIMGLYSLLKTKNMTMHEIENSLGSNICRCTGYRPILEAFKKFGVDAPSDSKVDLDIEDLHVCKKRDSCQKTCLGEEWCFLSQEDINSTGVIEIDLKDNKKWFRVQTLQEVLQIFKTQGTDSYMLVGGNTAKGARPIDEYPRILIDINDVPELHGYTLHQNLAIGSGTTLTEFLDLCEALSTEDGFWYLEKFAKHIRLVAHYPVRNRGTIAGNLMIKNKDNDFTSDIFLLLSSVGAELLIIDTLHIQTTITMEQFLSYNMKGKIILKVLLPPLSELYRFVSYKIMPRFQATHAKVNAAFLFKLDTRNVVQTCRIVYSGLSAKFNRAVSTEKHLVGKELFTNDTLLSALTILGNEIVVTENPPEPSKEFRKMLAINLFYKGLLSLCPKSQISNRYLKGASNIHEERPVTKATQSFDTDASIWPLNQPVRKLEGLIQCSGEAKYTDDMPKIPQEVYAALVLSTVGTGTIVSINPRKALKEPGVLAFYSANDIPGLNSFTPNAPPIFSTFEEVFCSGQIKYYNQPIGVIVAEDIYTAERAAKMVDVNYANVKTPVTDVKVARTDPNRYSLFQQSDATEVGTDVTKVIKNSNAIYGQYHMTMETLACVTMPTEEGIVVHTSGQYMDAVQEMVSRALLIDAHKVDVEILRVGGGYGIKISRAVLMAIACGLVTQKLNRACRIRPTLTTNMTALGKRLPTSIDVEVGVNGSGIVQYVNSEIYSDHGYTYNEALTYGILEAFNNCYKKARWNVKTYNAVTDTAKNTWCRSPWTLESIAMAERIMEQISYELGKDPLEVRLANLDDANYKEMRDVIQTLKTDAEYESRRAFVDKFNEENRWRKRGLRWALMRWTPAGYAYLDVTVSVYHHDGTVAITHGGVEMGQGVNTKAVQIAAYILNIPLSKIQIKGNNTMITPNQFVSGSSFTSQYVGVGVQRACEALLEKLAPVRATLTNPTWETLIQAAFAQFIDLQTHAFVNANDMYNALVYGATLAEVEIDVLTGETEIIRVDILEDVGRSVSPEIDVGQVEGAFIMGLGYWTSEHLVYDKSGQLLTDRTWNYYVPQANDIPQTFNVSFVKKSFSSAVVLGSKMTGEPATCMAVAVPFAIREAITAARQELGKPANEWFDIDGPYGIDQILLAISTQKEEFKFN